MRAATARLLRREAVMGLLRVGPPQLGRLRFGPWRGDARVSIHGARRRDRPDVLDVDHAAFEPFWRLDEPGLSDALAATTAVRFRLARAGGDVVGYAITGRAEHRGYVQRLAVSPAVQGRGVGAALLIDGLRWLRRRGAPAPGVNTP